jgi:NAD(P)-dependent dehydrogenase (short-subunit alcohol dehydrogenase family)
VNVLDLFSLARKVAVVTGGARGLGYQHAMALAEAGADVAVCDLLEAEGRNAREAIAALGRRAYFAKADVTVPDEINAFLENVIAELGKIDILVNNAAIPSEGCPLEEVDDAAWQRIIDGNLSSMFYVGKRVAKHMMARGAGGVIINIASINALVISNIAPRHNVTYCVAKAGVAQLTRGMAAEWAPYNIRVNALAPGYIHTAQTATTAKIPEVLERNIHNTPMKRYGRIDELKGSIVYLASEASSFMTGSIVTVDGGYTVW